MMYLPIKIIIADDHDVYRDGLKSLLEKAPNLEVIGEASNGQELIELCQKNRPDVVLTDILMPVMDGVEATAYLNEHLPEIRVIALSMFNQDNLILDMLRVGAKGYLIKNAHKNEILDAIDSVYKNIPYYCRSTSTKLARLIASNHYHGSGLTKPKEPFTEKELSIIKLICEEKTSKEIGDSLFLSSRTVEEYRQKIRDKMDVKTTAGIIIYAVKHALFKI